MKLSEIAEITGSTIEQGSPDLEIHGAAGLDIAAPDDISFLANPKYTPQVAETSAGAIFLSEGVETERKDIAVLRSEDAYVAYTLALRAFHPEPPIKPSIHPTAVIASDALVADEVEIGAHVVIGEACRIERGVRIHPNTTLYPGVAVGEDTVIHSGVAVRENCSIGARCIVHNNTTIGCDGFGYAKTKDKKWLKIPQVGNVAIEDDVEIGANTAIDCASVGESRIKRGTKIDNLVQIGHSCSVDEDALICSQTGLAGSSKIGKRVILAGQVGIAGHLKVGDDAVLTAKSATSHDVPEGKVISGIPGFDNREWLRSTAVFRRLGDLAARLRNVEKIIRDQKPR
ncbi:MAG: UDP-3-O-(3-hydroxymyristoyl)glucosamine N-acyltransferase [Acidobacteria bacterium]|nr:MAG: UDP-3-O-(3-hydroxymyristoyl)glucosamine N-acyltransferase [Acidobacteriota bacterium]REK02288.1 MAG: UDP-3-O-(3-hydroxymyristoyl)glucosamine N-acyltransferase [Acidobacteriota bacterium]REK13909.1 MAG: UDP-3-O-(3-hydroxymyristoyl)glucosamine N-acyltransferase [Acidobacteriota bacterium]REK41903.1 MAG: UDP-3-O-(3-hydroxymyristoyl)glucosamine N-acyltransferase [Acidobacteriota bacterium]